jgi:hypothetical protein
MSKVISTPTPDWFWESKSFTEGKRLPKYDNFPTITIPSNKKSASMLRQDTEIPLINENKHPLERIGHNLFYTNHGGLTNYPYDKLAVFGDLSYGSNPTDESQWGMIQTPHKLQWLNGEMPLGYNGGGVMSNPNKANKLRQVLGAALTANPGIQIGIYSWIDIIPLNLWYNNDTSALANYYNTPSTIYSSQIDAGCNVVMDAVYSLNDNAYDFTALYIYKKQLLKLKYGNNIPLYSLMWTENEGVDNFPGLAVDRKRQDGTFIDLIGAKHNANAEYMYNVAIVSLTVGDGIIGWEGVMPSIYTEDPAREPFGTDAKKPNLIQVQVGTDTWVMDTARVWKSCRLFWDLALYHVSLYKDIIEDTTNDWQTPDFEYNGNVRTGNFKQIPYNKLYKEPVVQLKYNNNKSEALILVHNPWASNLDTKQVRVFDITTGLDETVMVKGTKCELYKVILTTTSTPIPIPPPTVPTPPPTPNETYNKCNNVISWNNPTKICKGNITTIGVSVSGNDNQNVEFSINGGEYQASNIGINGYTYNTPSTGDLIYFDARIVGCTSSINGSVQSCDTTSPPKPPTTPTPAPTNDSTIYKSLFTFNQKSNGQTLPTSSDYANGYLKFYAFSHGISRNITMPQDIGVICKFEYEILNNDNEVVFSCKDNYGGFHPNFQNNPSAESYYRVWTQGHSDYNNFQWIRDYFNNFTAIPGTSFNSALDRGNNHFDIYNGYVPLNKSYVMKIKNTGNFSFQLRAGTIDTFENPNLADIYTTIPPDNTWYNFNLNGIRVDNNNDGTRAYKINCYNH